MATANIPAGQANLSDAQKLVLSIGYFFIYSAHAERSIHDSLEVILNTNEHLNQNLLSKDAKKYRSYSSLQKKKIPISKKINIIRCILISLKKFNSGKREIVDQIREIIDPIKYYDELNYRFRNNLAHIPIEQNDGSYILQLENSNDTSDTILSLNHSDIDEETRFLNSLRALPTQVKFLIRKLDGPR